MDALLPENQQASHSKCINAFYMPKKQGFTYWTQTRIFKKTSTRTCWFDPFDMKHMYAVSYVAQIR